MDNEQQIVTLIGSKPSNLSHVMHNAAYQYLGLNYVYIPLAVSDINGMETTISCMKAVSNWRGSSVTMPYKEDVALFLDKIDPNAREIGAVNTIVKANGKDKDTLVGYNTDWIGAIEALKQEAELEGKKVVLIGAGGAARAIAYGLKEDKANVIVFNRTFDRAGELAETFGLENGGGLEGIANAGDYDILINATSVGAYPAVGEAIVDESVMKEGKIVMDIVAMPLETKLLRMAKDRGCRVIHGYKMLVCQAVPQFELFTGRKVTRDVRKVMERIVVEALK